MVTPLRVLSGSGPVRVELARWDQQLVVVKQLLVDSPSLVQRLEREAAVVRKLDHPNIVPLLAVEEKCLIYRYQPGLSLAEVLEGGQLPLELSVVLIQDVLRALSYAHQERVIHFDVKPDNIIVEGEKAMLTDFGFAKDLAMAAITHHGERLGTPNYMAPEQFLGQRNDPRSDLYSTGAVLYHMLTGHPPYGNQVLRFLTGDTRLKLAPLPAEAAPLVNIFRKSLARSPDKRFESARAMHCALEALTVSA